MSRIISIANQKGGVGKTTSTLNIGAGLARLGKRVLLIDLDAQANLTHSLGVNSPDHTIYGALIGEYSLKPIELSKRLHLIASTLDLAGAELELSNETAREFLLKDLIEPLKNKYDYILIDCAPSLGLLTVNALATSDFVFITIQTQYLALQGTARLVEVLEKIKKKLNKKLSLGGIILTQYDSRKKLDQEVSTVINEHFRGKVFKTKIRNNVALAEAPSKGKDIFTYDKKSYGAIDYAALCKEVIKVK